MDSSFSTPGAPIDSQQDQAREQFKAELDRRILSYQKNARRTYYAAYACFGMAVLASALSTIFAATDVLPNAALAIITAIPGLMLLTNSVLAFEKKADWYWRKIRRYDSTRIAIMFEGEAIVDASRGLRTMDEEMEKEYPRFGMVPLAGQPQRSVT